MKLIEILSYAKIIDLIFEAENRLFLSLPSIDDEIADALIYTGKKADIKIVIDNSEEVIRNGYGELSAIEKLREQDFNIYQSDGNLVSFIIIDDKGYFLFPQSKIFSENPRGANAFKIDPVTIQLLIQSYFPSEKNSTENSISQAEAIGDSIKHFENSFKEVGDDSGIIVSPFNETKYEGIKKKLEINQPLSPNLQRQINTYTAKIQFVELKFSGGNLENKIAQLPKKALPINSDELKSLLLTRIKMFQEIEQNEDYQKFQQFKDKVDGLRKKYLTPITCRRGKSIINMENKESFLSELKELKEESKTLNKLLTTTLEEGRLKTMDLLRKELNAFFTNNPPKEVMVIQKVDVKKGMVDEIINTIIASVKFPKVSDLIEDISLNELFYDLTWNDFKDEQLLAEFYQKEVMPKDELESIVELKKAFDVKK